MVRVLPICANLLLVVSLVCFCLEFWAGDDSLEVLRRRTAPQIDSFFEDLFVTGTALLTASAFCFVGACLVKQL